VIVSDITEFAAGEHPRAFDLKPPLPCHFEATPRNPSFAFLFPTLQNLRKENRVLKRIKIFQLSN
jgi:hypothetical protein